MNECFFKETIKTVEDIKNNRKEGDVCFALLTDTFLNDTVDDTLNNIKEVDKNTDFDFILHMGGIINGNNPEKISRWLLEKEFEKYKNCIKAKKLFVAKGETDGYRDETYCGQLAMNIMTNEIWFEETAFIDTYKGVTRPGNKMYYYADIPDSNVRVVVLCPWAYEIDTRYRIYDLSHRFDVEQLVWLKTEALNVGEDKTVLIFSNTIPFTRFDDGKDPFIYQGHSTEKVLQILQSAQASGVKIGAWIAGGYGYDCEVNIAGINYITVNSQIPKITEKAKISEARISESRQLGTHNQDSWDAVIVKHNERKLKLIRFGAGIDREIEY